MGAFGLAKPPGRWPCEGAVPGRPEAAGRLTIGVLCGGSVPGFGPADAGADPEVGTDGRGGAGGRLGVAAGGAGAVVVGRAGGAAEVVPTGGGGTAAGRTGDLVTGVAAAGTVGFAAIVG